MSRKLEFPFYTFDWFADIFFLWLENVHVTKTVAKTTDTTTANKKSIILTIPSSDIQNKCTFK